MVASHIEAFTQRFTFRPVRETAYLGIYGPFFMMCNVDKWPKMKGRRLMKWSLSSQDPSYWKEKGREGCDELRQVQLASIRLIKRMRFMEKQRLCEFSEGSMERRAAPA